MFLARGTAYLAALGLVVGAMGLAGAQQPGNPRNPNPATQANPNDRPAQTPSRTPRTPRPSGTTPATPAQPGTPGTGATPATPAQPGNAAANTSLGFVRASAAVNATVQTSDGQQIGTIADLLLTAPMGIGTTAGTDATTGTEAPANTAAPTGAGLMHGTQVFALINVDAAANSGRVAVIPWDLLRYENGVFVLGFDVSRLNDVPSVMLDDPRLLQSQQWLGQVNDFFADDLQQIQRARPDLDNVTPDTTTPNTPRPGTNPRTPGTGTTPRAPNPRTPNPGTTPAPRTSQPGAGTNPTP